MQKFLTYRNLNLLAAFVVVVAMSVAFFFQYVMQFEPCPLCISQRIAIVIIGFFFLMAGLHNPINKLPKILYALFSFIFAAIGLALAARQLYLQSLPPDQVPTCLPNLDYLVDILPLEELVSIMLRGTGDCSKVMWSFLGLSIPGWTFILFFSFGILSLTFIGSALSSNSTIRD